MRKILLALDATNPDFTSLDFAAYMGRLTKSLVTGVFLENIAADQKAFFKKKYGLPYIAWETDEDSMAFQSKMALIEKNISSFEEACINREVLYEVRRNGGIPAKDLIEESRFADLLIVDGDSSFRNRFDGTPSDFVVDILSCAECPVIIAPETSTTINQILFTYNRTPESFYAIKQFTYLFPQLHDRKVCVMQINETGEWATGERLKLKKWMETYYRDISFEALKGEPEEELADHLFRRKNMIIVLGAYGRNALSRFFKPSKADLLMRETFQPIFIAHR